MKTPLTARDFERDEGRAGGGDRTDEGRADAAEQGFAAVSGVYAWDIGSGDRVFKA